MRKLGKIIAAYSLAIGVNLMLWDMLYEGVNVQANEKKEYVVTASQQVIEENNNLVSKKILDVPKPSPTPCPSKKPLGDEENKKPVAASAPKKTVQKSSDSERTCLERIVEAEAGGQDYRGKVLVANVILNRVRTKGYPKTIKGVVFSQRNGCYQFSPVLDGRYYSIRVSAHTRKAVADAMSGVDFSKGAMYFMSRSNASSKNRSWFDTHLTKLFVYGGHEFFK